MALKFTVSTVRGRQVRVVIHRTRAAMVRAAERWAGDPTPADTQGCTHGYRGARNPQAVIRLNREDLTRRVIDPLTGAMGPLAGHGTFIAGVVRQLSPQARLLAVPVHVFAQMKGAYSLSWFSALWRTIALLVFCNIVVGLFVTAIIYLGLGH